MKVAFSSGEGLVVPYALFNANPNSIDDYNIFLYGYSRYTQGVEMA